MKTPVILASLLLAGGAVAAAVPRGADWLVVARPVRRCDLMVVPGGGAQERLRAAVDLMAGGACGRILFTGGQPGESLAGVRAMLEDLDPGVRIAPRSISRSTLEDAFVALETAREHGFSSVLVVTSPYHTRRAAWIFERVFAGTGVEVGVYPSGSFYMDYGRWWDRDHGRASVCGEYAKLWLYGAAAVWFAARAAAAAGTI